MEDHGPDPGTPDADDVERVAEGQRAAAVWAHVLGGLGMFVGFSFLGPLIVWLVKKDEDPFAEDQAREALNFHLFVFVAITVSTILLICTVGIVLLPLVWVVAVFLSVVGAMVAGDGRRYRYPLIVRILS